MPANPDGEFSEGHVALFDAYWDYNTQTLNNNLCPPLAEHEVVKDRKGTRIITNRTESNIDVNTTVFHAGDEFKHTVTADEKAKYKFLPPAGTQVWWLKQDDPIAEAAELEGEEEPELVLGISAGLFKTEHWYAKECDLQGENCTEIDPLEYEFEAIRDPEGNVIPFVVFENDAKDPIWDSRNADTSSITLEPGEYKHYNWVFFPGDDQSHTYVLEVHMKGHVRVELPEGRTKDNWRPLTWPKGTPYDPANELIKEGINRVVTSELVKQRYTIHVGTLHLNEQPRLGVYRVAPAGAAAGTRVGEPIHLYGVDRDTLQYELLGDGSEDFSPREQIYGTGVGVEITVAQGADLRYAERPYYDLRLTVSDGHDHEDGQDTSIDDTIPVRIQVFPTYSPYVAVRFPNENPRIRESMLVDAGINRLPADAAVTGFTLREGTDTVKDGASVISWETVGQINTSDQSARFYITKDEPGTRRYEVVVSYQPSEGDPGNFKSALYPITWRR